MHLAAGMPSAVWPLGDTIGTAVIIVVLPAGHQPTDLQDPGRPPRGCRPPLPARQAGTTPTSVPANMTADPTTLSSSLAFPVIVARGRFVPASAWTSR
jgi:hypothetical protein